LRTESGHRTHIITTRRMATGELLKYGLLIALPYHDHHAANTSRNRGVGGLVGAIRQSAGGAYCEPLHRAIMM
jgi:hypothetical protein